jgi:hypothetical protein
VLKWNSAHPIRTQYQNLGMELTHSIWTQTVLTQSVLDNVFLRMFRFFCWFRWLFLLICLLLLFFEWFFMLLFMRCISLRDVFQLHYEMYSHCWYVFHAIFMNLSIWKDVLTTLEVMKLSNSASFGKTRLL